MENKCYNVILKFIRESEDIIAAACICSAGSSVLENPVMLVLFFLLSKIIIEKIDKIL